jgi:NAD(P)-dependent dehydrogenase (short-subunit alcohol dehydrogenase family)
MQLKGKVALITGGGTGIGTAIAKRFVAEGAKICITGRRQQMLEDVARSLPAGTTTTCSGDVSKYEDAQRMVEATITFGGKIDILVNNAGIDPGGTVVDIDPEVWRKVLDINLTGPFFLMKASIPHMIKAGAGSIINIASAYCSSKAGLIMLTQQTATDYGPFRVRCNVVCPGGVRTAMIENSLSPLAKSLGKTVDGVLDLVSSGMPLRRFALPDEIPGVCVYLASDDSTFMTGSVLLIDGGAANVDVAGAALTMSGVNWGVTE